MHFSYSCLVPLHIPFRQVPSDLIALDPTAVLKVDRRSEAVKKLDADEEAVEAEKAAKDGRRRVKGRSSTMRRYLKKQANVIDAKRLELKAKLAQERQAREAAKKSTSQGGEGNGKRRSNGGLSSSGPPFRSFAQAIPPFAQPS
jgi:U3 small nucleolar RNA-associated protein 7